jgi:hypothetical protein
MADENALHELAELLSNTTVRTRVSRQRLAPSSLYDLNYRETLIACAFGEYAKPDLLGVARIPEQRLKLVQFVAARPGLLPMVRRWSKERSDPQATLFSKALRRGFLDDRMHDDVVAYLLAGGVLLRSGVSLTQGERGDLLRRLHRHAVEHELFAQERQTLRELRRFVITNRMLEGR